MATNTEKVVVQVIVKGGKELDNLTNKTGKATKGVGGLTSGFKKMTGGVLAAVAAFSAVSSAIGSAIKSFKGFEFQMAKVKAITGANNSQFKLLTDSAKDLGRSTFFTATQVAELQANFGKLGFSTGEILEAQKATLALATATDTDLARAAVVAGAAVRGFGLSATETSRVTDVMAKVFTSTAMDIEKWQTSMTKVAPIAATAGISIESTAAVMGKLTDVGIEASIAGTSLRNIFLKMQNSSSDLSQFLGYTVNSSADLNRALQDLNDAGLSNEEVMGLVDKRQVAAFNTMIRGAGDIQNLTNELNNANGALGVMVDIIEDTLEGDLKKLTSAYDGLKTELGEAVSPQLRESATDLTELTNAATDNATAIVGIGSAVQQITMWLGRAISPIDKFTFAMKKLITMPGLTKFTDMIGLSTPKKDTTAEDRLARLNANLQTTLDLSNSNAKVTKTSISFTKSAIYMRERELDIIKEKNKNLPSVVNKEEEKRVEKELKTLRENLKFREDTLDVFEKQVNVTEESNRKIKAKKDKAAAQVAKTAAEKRFSDEKTVFDIALTEELNAYKEMLINKTDTQAEFDEKVRLAEEAHLEDMKNLNIKYGKDVSDINSQILDKDLEQIKKKADLERQTNEDDITNKEAQIEAIDQLSQQMMRVGELEEGNNELKRIGIQLSQAVAVVRGIELLQEKLSELQAYKTAAAKGVEAAATIAAAGADATGAVAKAANNVFPFNLIAIASTIAALISVVANAKSLAKSFGDGGVIDTFANGGMVHGKSHAQGGERFAVGGRVVELEGGEAVINKRSTAMFSGQLSAMNAAGGGVKFADGGLLNQPSFSQQQFNAVGQNQMMGAMGSSGKVVVVESDITDSQNTVSVIQSQATI